MCPSILRRLRQHIVLATILYLARPVSAASVSEKKNASALTVTRPNPIRRGYVAFGDSFAAGIGTGTTIGSGCRQGEFSYPKQLAATASNIDFQDYTCSGAKATDLLSGNANSQVDLWQRPQNADIATISIGGNDLGFFNILNACVLWIEGQALSGDCDRAISNGMSVLAGGKLFQDIFITLQQIVEKSGRADFKLYMTGYPSFFNVDTTSCNDASFNYWNPHRRFIRTDTGPFLDLQLRLSLNKLIQSLNYFLFNLINELNTQYTNTPIVFIPTDPVFNGHRFCEQGVTEPDSTHPDTWFFLSGWGDNKLPGATAEFVGDDLIASGNTSALLDPSTCDIDAAADMFDTMTCMTAKAVSVDGSFEQSTFLNDTALVAEGELWAVRVPWWLPTRQAKTFHPKSLGHLAYRNAIMQAW